ncbi:hypothetical protein [Shewanella goraebulensis]|uniref:hypothetical protein n=1 Tax=Shewanella goraebulensis TaxID=3050637 RepID=UPI00254B8D08|nr:hypothetical protein [Shewanella goraebulensis]
MKALLIAILTFLLSGCVSSFPSIATTAELCHMWIYKELAISGHDGIEKELNKRGVMHMCEDIAKGTTNNGIIIKQKQQVIHVSND